MYEQSLSWVGQVPVGAEGRLERLLMLPGPCSDLIYKDATAKASKSPTRFGP